MINILREAGELVGLHQIQSYLVVADEANQPGLSTCACVVVAGCLPPISGISYCILQSPEEEVN